MNLECGSLLPLLKRGASSREPESRGNLKESQSPQLVDRAAPDSLSLMQAEAPTLAKKATDLRLARLTPLVLLVLIGFAGTMLQAGTPAVVHLIWDPGAEEFLAGYHVYRADAPGGTFVRLTEQPVSTPEYIDSSVQHGKPYFYRVTAVGPESEESRPSETLELVAGEALSDTQTVTLTVQPGELVILSVDRFGLSSREGGIWIQVSGPEVDLAQAGNGIATFVAPEGQSTQMVFRFGVR